MGDFNEGNNLEDPAQLMLEMESMADGCNRQADATRFRGGQGGHPNPHFFFNRVASVLRAAIPYVKVMIPEPKTEPVVPVPSPEPKADKKKI